MGYKLRSFTFAAAVALVVAAAAVIGGCAAQTGKPFCIIALPDTQLYSKLMPEIYISQTQWIVDKKDEMNIAFVVHEGDVTNENWKEQWNNADKAMTILDGQVPYAIAIGNHDMGPSGNTIGRDSRLFNEHFPVSRFEGKPWYGGHYGDNNDNSYHFFKVGGMKFLVVALEFGPREEVLEWANKVVAENEDRRTVVVTHGYLNSKGKRVSGNMPGSPHTYPCNGNDGDELWEKFLSKHENIFLVLCGHMDGRAGRTTSLGRHGNIVHQLMANYQFDPKGGNGYLRVMKFVPKEDKIHVTTYSPYLNKNMTDANNQFVLEYDMTD